MKIFKKILVSVLMILMLISILFLFYWQYQKPQYEGEKTIANLNKSTKVYFDNYGIPHIYADNQHDAMVALGYVHAQDRLWQMELLRRIAPGRLSEIFGTKALNSDKFFAGICIDESSEKAVALLDKKSQAYLLSEAYLDGINQYVKVGKTPVEFSLLGIQKTKFTLKDVYNTFGFMAFSFAMAQKTDPILTDLRNNLNSIYLKDLGVNYENNFTRIKISTDQKIKYGVISKQIAAILNSVPAAPFVGSNAWVIGAEKTVSKKVLFCNDPHIGYSQPGTWYEAHLSTPDFENYGYYVAGTPFPLLGHNRQFAFGMTMFENDDADFFEEKLNPKNNKQYQLSSAVLDLKIIEKIIKVKDSLDVKITVKSTIHGPIINDFLQDFDYKSPVSLSWIHTSQPNKVLEATYGLSHARSLSEFQRNIAVLSSPGLNIMYGDAQNNIAWFTTGKLYRLQKNVNPNFILDGNNGIDDKKDFFDFDKNPKAINPAWNFVYSSNNMPEPVDGYHYPGYYLPEDRAKRITSLIEKKSDWNSKSATEMLLDHTSENAAKYAKIFISVVDTTKLTTNEKASIKILRKWTGSHNLHDVAPTIYNKFIYFYLKNTFSDEMGISNFEQFLNTHLVKQIVGVQIQNLNSVWWDNVHTKKIKESRAMIINKSFRESIANLEKQHGQKPKNWIWSRSHKLEIKHALGSIFVLKPLFNIRSTAIAGSCEVLNNTMFIYSNDAINEVKAGPSTRRFIDFSDVENGLSILPSGNSGNPFSKHYNDQASLYIEGKFRKMMLNKKEIIAKSTLLILKP